VLNTTFSNISAILWQPVLVVEEAGVPERTTDHGQATGKLYHLRLRVECTLFCNCLSILKVLLLTFYHNVPTFNNPYKLAEKKLFLREYVELFIAMQLQLKFEAILTYNKAALDN
jgi:hypothetical protein